MTDALRLNCDLWTTDSFDVYKADKFGSVAVETRSENESKGSYTTVILSKENVLILIDHLNKIISESETED